MTSSPNSPTSTDAPATPAPAAPVSEIGKIWNWVKKETVIVEGDVASILGSSLTQKLEAIGKELLDSELGPLATAAIADATDVVTGQMSVSKAIESLVAAAEAAGKTLSKSAALQVIGIAQNALPVGTTQTVTPAP